MSLSVTNSNVSVKRSTFPKVLFWLRLKCKANNLNKGLSALEGYGVLMKVSPIWITFPTSQKSRFLEISKENSTFIEKTTIPSQTKSRETKGIYYLDNEWWQVEHESCSA